ERVLDRMGLDREEAARVEDRLGTIVRGRGLEVDRKVDERSTGDPLGFGEQRSPRPGHRRPGGGRKRRLDVACRRNPPVVLGRERAYERRRKGPAGRAEAGLHREPAPLEELPRAPEPPPRSSDAEAGELVGRTPPPGHVVEA